MYVCLRLIACAMGFIRREKKVTVRAVINTIAYMRKRFVLCYIRIMQEILCMYVCMHICRGRFIPEILEELDLVEQECVYREIVADLVTHISSQVRVGLGACVGSPYEMQVHV